MRSAESAFRAALVSSMSWIAVNIRSETLSQFLDRATILSDHLMLNYRAELPAVYTRGPVPSNL